jgi:hypothetical protein
VSLASVSAVHIDALPEVIPDLLKPVYQRLIHQNGIALATLALELIQPEVLRQLDFVFSFVLLDHGLYLLNIKTDQI